MSTDEATKTPRDARTDNDPEMTPTRPDRQAEAIENFREVVAALVGDVPDDLRPILRKCALGCVLAGWVEHQQWLAFEIQGYPEDAELPDYRSAVLAYERWVTDDSALLRRGITGSEDFREQKSVEIGVRDDVWIVYARSQASSAPTWRTGKKKSYRDTTGNHHLLHREAWIPRLSYHSVLQRVVQRVFRVASDGYVTLQYGGALEDIWQRHYRLVSRHLPTLGLDHHLSAIEVGLRSPNPQEQRQVLWSCRDLLHDLAARLWQDPRPTYTHLPGSGVGGRLRVSGSDHINRLGAYIHEKAVTGSLGGYLRAEMERLYGSISALTDLVNTAHVEANPADDARTVALGTFFVLGELIQRTDMVPVTHYSDAPPNAEARTV